MKRKRNDLFDSERLAVRTINYKYHLYFNDNAFFTLLHNILEYVYDLYHWV